MARSGLSKSKIMAGLQCPRRLWLETNRPDLVQYGPAQQRVFRQGHDVGRLARDMHPGGVLVGAAAEAAAGDGPPPRGWLAAAQRETADLLADGGDIILYEATFIHQGVLVRADVLERRDGRTVVTEVKSSTSVKDQHVTDAAVQAWVITRSGLRLHGVRLATVDRDWVYDGDGDYAGLLVETDVSGRVHLLLPEIPGIVLECRRVLAGALPAAPVGRHCRSPYQCPLLPYCRGELGMDAAPLEAGEAGSPAAQAGGTAAPAAAAGPRYHVDLLPRGGRLVEQLQAEGYVDLCAVPPGRLTNLDHLRVWRASLTEAPQIDTAIGGILRALPYPRTYLDFETISWAVPRWAGTRPWQQAPFQFSCHIEPAAAPAGARAARVGAGQAALVAGDAAHATAAPEPALEHVEFLDTSGDDPTRACAQALLSALEPSPGPIIAYSSFEQLRIQEMAAACPDLAARLLALVDRIVDLLPIVRDHYYHPAMRGSWSLKAVLPTVTPDLRYDALPGVSAGDEAQAAYEEAIWPQTSRERRGELRAQLLAYCALDTLAMVRLVRHFEVY